jgi:hypothetical protein
MTAAGGVEMVAAVGAAVGRWAVAGTRVAGEGEDTRRKKMRRWGALPCPNLAPARREIIADPASWYTG